MIPTKKIKNPRITEKAALLAEKNMYTFNVHEDANKTEIKKAIEALYKVKPVRVSVLSVPKKNIFYRGKSGTKSGGKKAVIYLKAGDKINFV